MIKRFALPLSVLALVISILSLFDFSGVGALSPKEILEAERECKSRGLEASYFRSAYYRDIRYIECEQKSRTVYY